MKVYCKNCASRMIVFLDNEMTIGNENLYTSRYICKGCGVEQDFDNYMPSETQWFTESKQGAIVAVRKKKLKELL